jgi:hypothetical protein
MPAASPFPPTTLFLSSQHMSTHARAHVHAHNSIFNEGTNDGGGNITANFIAVLNGLAAACPGTPMVLLRPFNGEAQTANLKAACAGSANPQDCCESARVFPVRSRSSATLFRFRPYHTHPPTLPLLLTPSLVLRLLGHTGLLRHSIWRRLTPYGTK